MNKKEKSKRGSFTGQIGFIIAAASSAIGLGNLWRFPYLAAKDGGGIFIFCYIILALTFGFTLLTTEVAIGRKTGQSSLTAYKVVNKNFGWLGYIASLVPVIILPYYSAIGGWVLKYLTVYCTGKGQEAVSDSYFGSFIGEIWAPIIFMLIFLACTIYIVYSGVEKGIERFSKILMPILLVLIIVISVQALTLKYTDDNGITRTGLEGLKVYLIPNFEGMTFKKFLLVIMDALGQLFFSISVAMGIMVAYGSYSPKDSNLMSSINQIELFDSLAALLAGVMIIPAVFTFSGIEGMSSGGPGLMFVSLPKVFDSMGFIGAIVGAVFFIIVTFAAVTSSVSIMEAIVSSICDKWHISRHKATIFVAIYAVIVGTIVCLGFNLLSVDVSFPNGSSGGILDIMDYVSNNWLMPIVALVTCILVGWVVGPKYIIEEVEDEGKYKFGRKWVYIIMIKIVAPVLLFVLLLQAFGVF